MVQRVYDLVMTHKLDADDLFIHRVQFHCARLRLNFFLVDPTWVTLFHERFVKGELWAKVLLNMHSEHHRPEDVYSQLVKIAAERGTQVIDPPDVAQAAFDKARCHYRLIEAGLVVPYTVIVANREVGTFKLSQEQKQSLGVPFVIKPSLGYGRRGVLTNATDETQVVESARQWPGSDYLLQRLMVPAMLEGWPAYFRVYYAFGSVWCNWWNCYTDRSRPVTPEEVERFGLTPLVEMSRKIAGLSRMRFFSTEILKTDQGEFVVIDYVNDQCHMLSQSANPQIGVPDPVVEAIAERLVEGAALLARGGSSM